MTWQLNNKKILSLLVCFIVTLICAARIGFCEPQTKSPNAIQSVLLEQKQPQAVEAQVLSNDPALPRLDKEVRRLASMAGGTVGLSALHVESGRCFSLNGTERFPMASAYKIPIAVQLLRRVDGGEIRLDQAVTLRSSDIHPGSGKLISSFKKKTASYTVRELLELMLLVSDNTASDAVLNLAGGPEAVTTLLQSQGIRDLDVSRSTLNMLADWRGIEKLPSREDFSVEKYNQLRNKVPADVLDTAQDRFYSDTRDTGTPDAMTRLISMVYCGTVLKPESTAVFLNILGRCQTGQSRIKKLIPPGMKTANKTGTIGKGIVNDVALLTLPDDAGHVALTIFIKTSDHSVSQQEQAMAQIARYIYDYYFFSGTAPAVPAACQSCSSPNPACYSLEVQ